MKHNPFTSDIFSGTWKEHFVSDPENLTPGPTSDLYFFKKGNLPLFVNQGDTLSKGITYSLSEDASGHWSDKVFLIQDVPTYFNLATEPVNNNLGHYKSKQYPGFLIDLEPYKDLAEFMSKRFSKSSRYKLNKYKRRLEESFEIRYEMYRGAIDKETYDYVFENFRLLLEKRFDEKGIYNNNLNAAEWNFYYDLTYPMILQGTAGLYVIYHQDKPIGVTLNFFSEDILFDAITVFDINFFKFHLGSVTIMKLIEWSLENGIKTFDFSKGHFDYKARWASQEYHFEYHIYYDKRSLMSRILARSLKLFLDFKQSLRAKGVNEKLHRLTYGLKNRGLRAKTAVNYQFIDTEDEPDPNMTEVLDLTHEENEWLKPMVFEFLYLTTEDYKSIRVFQLRDTSGTYLIRGKETRKVMKLQ